MVTTSEGKTINVYGPNDRAPKYRMEKLTEVKEENHKSTSSVGDFKTPHLVIDRVTKRKKRNHNIEELKCYQPTIKIWKQKTTKILK